MHRVGFDRPSRPERRALVMAILAIVLAGCGSDGTGTGTGTGTSSSTGSTGRGASDPPIAPADVEAIATDTPHIATGEEGLLVMEVLDAIYASAAQGKPVRCRPARTAQRQR